MVQPRDVPVTVTLAGEQPGNRWGPGIALSVTSHSPSIPPVVGQAFWNIATQVVNTVGTFQVFKFPYAAEQPNQLVIYDPAMTVQVPYTLALPTDTQVNVTAFLHSDPNTVIEEGSTPVNWDAESGLPFVIQKQGGQGGQGLTTEQAQQLQELHDANTPFINLSELLLPEFTNGPQGGSAAAELNFPVFGILVRITFVPPDILPSSTPDPYWFPSLAVVQIFRGSDLWMRVPIHTLTKIVGLLSQDLTISATLTQQLEFSAGSGVQIIFREGVLGQAFLMRFP